MLNHVMTLENCSLLYRNMLLIRLAEEKVIELYPTDKIQSPVHLSIGQEAVSAGVCQAMRPGDRIYGTYRSHGLYLACSQETRGFFAELFAKDTGCSRGKGGSMHLAHPQSGLMGCSAIVASTIPVACGDALAAKMRKEDRVVIAFFGDGAIDEGVFYESVNFAALKQIPVLFVCENNNYAVHSKVRDRHRQTELYRYAEGLGLKGKRYDGNDANLVFKTMTGAIDAMANGSPPLLLEYVTYRWAEHVGIGSDQKEAYRDRERLSSALRNDPLKIQKEYLIEQFDVTESQFKDWETEINDKIADGVRFAEESPFPEQDRLLADTLEDSL